MRILGATLGVALALLSPAAPDPGSEPAHVLDDVRFTDGHRELGRGRSIGLELGNSGDVPFSVRPAAVLLRLFCAHFCTGVGPRDIAAAGVGVRKSLAFPDRQSVDVEIPVPRDLEAGIYRATLVDDGAVTGPNRTRWAVPEQQFVFVSIPPVSSHGRADAAVVRVRAEFDGRIVQGFGPLEVACDPPYGDLRSTLARGLGREAVREVPVGRAPSLLVTGVERPAGPNEAWRVGGAELARHDLGEQLKVVMPIRVDFADLSTQAGSAVYCRRPHVLLADEWEVDRTLFVHAPSASMSYDSVKIGMTKFDVAEILGFPETFGTLDEMLRLSVWQYPPDRGLPDPEVDFTNDRVSSYDLPDDFAGAALGSE